MIAPSVKAAIALAGLYLLLTGNAEGANLVAAAVIGAIIAILLRPSGGGWSLRRLPVILWAAAVYAWIVLWDVVFSGTKVARIVLRRRLALRPGIVAIPSGCRSELGQAISAHAITIAPGEMVIAIDEEGVMYTHCLDAEEAAGAVAQQEKRRKLLARVLPEMGRRREDV